MAIEVETKDCTALSDAELAEMADICADGPEPVRGRAAVEAGRGVGARHPGPRERQAQGLLVLHPRAHRRHAVRAHRAGVGEAHRQARHGAAGDHARPAAAGPCWPSPTRTSSSAPASPTPCGLRGVQGARTTSCPGPDHKATGEERAWGRRLAKRFGVDARQLRRPRLHRQGRRLVPAGARPREPEAREARRRLRGAVRRHRRRPRRCARSSMRSWSANTPSAPST